MLDGPPQTPYLQAIDDAHTEQRPFTGPDASLPILQTRGNASISDQEILVPARYRCPHCGAVTRFAMVFLVYPEEGLWCPDCGKSVIIGSPPQKLAVTLSGGGPLDRQVARAQVRGRQMSELGPTGISPNLRDEGDLETIADQIATQAEMLAFLDDVADAPVGRRTGFASVESSLGRLQHAAALVVLGLAVGIGGSIVLTSFGLSSKLLLVASVCSLLVGLLLYDYKTLSNALTEHGYDDELGPSDFLRLPVVRVRPAPIGAIGAVWSSLRSLIP